MKLKEIYDLFIRMGIENDPRGPKAVKKQLDKVSKEYDKLGDKEKKEFDAEKMKNPFADTRILYGDPETEVKAVLTGIDMETAEIVLADRLREKGVALDLVIAHHPEGQALANLDAVMAMQADIWEKFGVPVNIGDALIEERMREVQRGFMPINHARPVDSARLLDIPFMCAHTVADNMVTTYLQAIFDDKVQETVKDVMDVLKEIPEYKIATQTSIGPKILVGSENKRCGRIMVDMTGGTGGPKQAIQKLADAGVGTFVGMHMSDKNREEAEKSHVNVVIAGHIASDTIGMNLLLDALEQQGVEITTCSGLTRVKRY
jgi:putative NIF3 family GTP cyclohydrolase 1 type 2